MSGPHRLSLRHAREIAVRAQRLDAARPDDVVEVVRDLTLLQIDPVSAVAPSADLVVWSRIGSAYDPRDLVDALEEQRLVEHDGMVRPLDHLALYRADMEAWPGADPDPWEVANADWVAANDGCRRDVLERLRADGPLPQSELPDTCEVTWGSSGWNNNKNVAMLLGRMVERGEVVVVGRHGRERMWDLASRVYPDDPFPGVEEAARLRNLRRLGSLGIARAKTQKAPSEPWDVGPVGEPAVVEGVPGEWRVDPAQLERPFAARAALLSPFDRLVHDRRRMQELWDFDYQLEMYKPAAARRWGYYALPVLYGERLVGKLDAKADRRAGVLTVHAVHEDEPWGDEVREAVEAEIADLARWLGLHLVR